MICLSLPVAAAQIGIVGTNPVKQMTPGIVPTIDASSVASCPSGTYVVLTQAELDQYVSSPWKLDLSEAGPIIGAVLLLWAVGYGFRMAIRAVRDVSAVEFEGGE